MKKPKGADFNEVENLMNDDEFSKAMGVTKAQYLAMPGWKKADLRKKKNLF